MAPATFFKSWQLWEEMTFVLAMSIVAVFLMGLIRLWSSNRRMRKVEQLDAEKQARTTQTQKSGIPAVDTIPLGGDIPFGVKALDSGVQVDGIWVAMQPSLSSQPPSRRWNSRKKTRIPTSLVEMSDLMSPTKKGRMGPIPPTKTDRVSRNEILDSSCQEREKSEDGSLLEGAHRSEPVDNRGPSSLSDQVRKSPLSRIQRGLRRKASETWHDQNKKRHAGSLDPREFHERAQAKKPKRFYSENEINFSTTTPLMTPTAKIGATENQLDVLTAHGASEAGGGPPTWGRSQKEYSGGERSTESQLQVARASSVTARQAQLHQSRQQDSNSSRFSPADSFVSNKGSTALGRDLEPQATRPSEDRALLREAPAIPVRRSSRGSERRAARNSAEAGRSGIGPENESTQSAQSQPPDAQALRYPPNSSRSGPASQRSQPFAHHFNSGKEYAKTCRRNLIERHGVVPAASLGQYGEQRYEMREPASPTPSVRSSVDSQTGFPGRIRLQEGGTWEMLAS